MNRPMIRLLLLGLLWVPAAAPRAAETRYRYVEENPEQEQRQFLLRLKQDRAKIDRAIENTRVLIDRSRQRPYLPELYLRLAELYVEKSRVVFFIRKAEMPAGVKSLSNLESHALKRKAVEIYQRILDNHPGFPYRDKVLFFMAHEYRELGQIEPMLDRYRELIRKHPRSPYAPEAHLLLGDHYFNSQELEPAKRHYEAVLGYTDSPAVAVARYKLAWCYINEADYGRAIELFEAALQAAAARPDADIDTYRKVDIRLESLIDMAFCYPEKYRKAAPDEAIRYFERHAWSRPALTKALEKLANRFFVKKKWRHAAAVYRKLAAIQHDPDALLEYAGRLFECVRAVGRFESADRDMALIVKALRRVKYSSHIPDDVKRKILRDYELYARDIATHLHQKALEEKSPERFRVAAAAYETYLGLFEDSEVRDEMRRNYAETLFAAGDYLEAGKQYEALAGSGLRSERERRDDLYSAVVAYHRALKTRQDLDPYQKAFARAGLREVGRRYTDEYPTADKVPAVLFNVAWIAYDEGDYDTALEEFSRFVRTYPRTPEAKAAVHLILDVYNLQEDYEGLAAYGRWVLGNDALDTGLKAEVARIVQASETKILYPLALAAADDWERGREGLAEFAREHRATSLGEQALQTLVASSAEMQDLPTLLRAARELLETYPASAKTEQTLNLLIDVCVRASQLRELARYLEEFARRLPGHPSREEFLLKAAQIRRGLGQPDLAGADDRLLLGIEGLKADPGPILLAMAADAAEAGRADRARRVLEEGLAAMKGADRVTARARIASLLYAGGRPGDARKVRDRVIETFRKDKDLWDTPARDAVAEMEYRALEPLRAEYMGLRLGTSIDQALVRRKGDLLGRLLKGYHRVIQLKSPRWAMAACYRAHQVNAEFGRFLREAPVPDLPPEQRAQYLAIVEEKARGYEARGREYREQCVELARRWETCDPRMAPYFIADMARLRAARAAGPPPRETGDEWLTDPGLLALHKEAMGSPGDPAVLGRLAARYLELGDYPHALVIARRALDEAGDAEPGARADLYNILGVAHLYAGQDPLAKEAFLRALEARPDHAAARVNLAGLYRLYEHHDRAAELYRALRGAPGPADGAIHPRSRELYDAFLASARAR